MVEWWWGLVAASIPLAAAQHLWLRPRSRNLLPRDPDSSTSLIRAGSRDQKTPDDLNTNNFFFCERVCTSKRMLNKVGAFSKDPNPSNTCVTVCGASQVDACSDACARSVCSNQHHIPNWNDICLRRCQNQCLQLQASSP